MIWQENLRFPDSPSRHHLPFDRPFDKLTVLSKVEGLMALSNIEGLTALSEVEGSMLSNVEASKGGVAFDRSSPRHPPSRVQASRGQACGVLLHTPQSSLLGTVSLSNGI
jgi:hypothetical protein